MMRSSSSSYRTLWPIFAVLAVGMWILVALRPGGYQVFGAALLSATAVVAYLRGRHESRTTER